MMTTQGVWVWIEQFKGEVMSPSWEALGAARVIADTYGGGITACLFGAGVQGVAQQAIQYGADRVFVADDATLEDFRAEAYAALLAQLAQEHSPAVILFGATTCGRELAPTVAAALDTGAIADVTALEIENHSVVATRPIYSGKLLAKCVISERRPQVISLRPRAFPRPEPDDSLSGEIIEVAPALSEDEIKNKVTGFTTAEGQVSLADAEIIVSGGRGVNGPDGFAPIQELAQVLGGAVGASRAAVDAGWVPYAHQVGQTGKTVSPDLYIACGISGAIQHQAGMRTSKVIVAINKDPDAPIFKLARYGIVGDLFQVVPELTSAFKEKLT
jgi:electron transfer flavoprotein alpha subunit